MTRRDMVKRAARAAAASHGHSIPRFKALHFMCDVANCALCGCALYVQHGSGSINGDTVYTKCKGSQ